MKGHLRLIVSCALAVLTLSCVTPLEIGTLEDIDVSARANGFSGVILLAVHGEIAMHEAYGWADREAKVPNRTDTRFAIASLTNRYWRIAEDYIESVAAGVREHYSRGSSW